MTQQIENFLFDLLDKFTPGQTQDAYWLAGNEVAADLGGTSLTMGSVGVNDGIPRWMRSSMGAGWLDEYVGKKYYESDRLTAHTKFSGNPLTVCAGTETDRTDRGWYDLNHSLVDAGYYTLYLTPFATGEADQRSAVTFNSKLSPHEMSDPKLLRKIRILSTFMIANIGAPGILPGQDDGRVILAKAALTPRERETLTYLAKGMRNTQIAHKMGIEEVSVRKNTISARSKLGASTREQAVALAVKHGLIQL